MKIRTIGKASNIYEHRQIYKNKKFNNSGEAYHRFKLNQYQWNTPILSKSDFNSGNGANDDLRVLGYKELDKVMLEEYLRVTT